MSLGIEDPNVIRMLLGVAILSFVIGVFLVRRGRRRTHNEERDARDLRDEGYPTATEPTGGQPSPPERRAVSRAGSTAAVDSRDPAGRGTSIAAPAAAARHSDDPAVHRKHELPRAGDDPVRPGNAVFVPLAGSPVPSQVQTPTRHRSPGHSCRFDLILFDLDDTLVLSGGLERFRGRENVGLRTPAYVEELTDEASRLTCLITQPTLIRLTKSFPDLKLGVLTRAPRTYTDVLLRTCYPEIRWDSVVTFEDVRYTKPHPEGVRRAATETGVRLDRIAIVGDSEHDIIAAYQAGAYSVLFTLGWGTNWRSDPLRWGEHYHACELHPDAIVERPDLLADALSSPLDKLPLLEYASARKMRNLSMKKRRIDRHRHFHPGGSSLYVDVSVMGRYFAANSNGKSRYNYSPRMSQHPLTKKLLEIKDGAPWPDEWVQVCKAYILDLVEHSSLPYVVCPIPAKPGRPYRLEYLVSDIAAATGSHDRLVFDNDILYFRDGAVSNKNLGQQDRFENIQNTLVVADLFAVQEKVVIVIDDIVTSGATLFYADQYLRDADAHSVVCLALAHTIS